MSKRNKEVRSTKGLKKVIRKSQREEMQFILHQTELPIIHKFSDANIDREKEIIQLRGGGEISIHGILEEQKRLRKFIRAKVAEHTKTFPDEIYNQWRRLRGWDKLPYAKHHKPMVFAWYTVRYIYGRFPKEIYPELDRANIHRLYRHFQKLTKKAYASLEEYIKDVIKVARASNNMYEFKGRYAMEFGEPFQISLFEDNGFIS